MEESAFRTAMLFIAEKIPCGEGDWGPEFWT